MYTRSGPPPLVQSSNSSLLNLDDNSLLPALIAAALVETLLYGIHLVLFCICVFIFVRDRRPTHWFILGSAFIMFALSTADVSLSIRLMTHDITTTLDYMLKHAYPKNPIFVTNNFIAELVLLYRCYMIWGRSKYLLVATSFLVLGDTVWGFLSTAPSFLVSKSRFLPVYQSSVLAINVVISMIAAGRIFWISQNARPILGPHILRQYHFIIAILLVSSAVYSTCVLIYLLFPPYSHYRIVLAIICMRMVAIMPTLLIVQVGLDRISQDSDSGDCERPAGSIIFATVIIGNHENQDTPHSDAHEGSIYP